MVQTALQCEEERVSPSMVRSVFGMLKANGYSDGQIAALCHGLAEMAQLATHQSWARRRVVGEDRELDGFFDDLALGYDLTLLGFPEGFETACVGGLGR